MRVKAYSRVRRSGGGVSISLTGQAGCRVMFRDPWSVGSKRAGKSVREGRVLMSSLLDIDLFRSHPNRIFCSPVILSLQHLHPAHLQPEDLFFPGLVEFSEGRGEEGNRERDGEKHGRPDGRALTSEQVEGVPGDDLGGHLEK